MAKSPEELLADFEYSQAHPEASISTHSPTRTEKENVAWMASSSYITSTEAADVEKALASETSFLIDSAVASLVANMLQQLEQAAALSHQYTGNTALMTGRTAVDVYDGVVRDTFHTSLLHAFAGMEGIKIPIIIIDVSSYLDEANTLTPALKRTNFSLVPTRLIQTSVSPLTRESTASFASAFTAAVKSSFAAALEGLTDVRPGELFARQQLLHKHKHRIGETTECCLFKLLEEDFKMPYDKSKLDDMTHKYVVPMPQEAPEGAVKHLLAEFSVPCAACGVHVHHEFKVVR